MFFVIVFLLGVALVTLVWFLLRAVKAERVAKEKLGLAEIRIRSELEVEIGKKATETLRSKMAVLQDEVDARVDAVARREVETEEVILNVKKLVEQCLVEIMKNLTSRMTVNNFVASKKRLQTFLSFAEQNGIAIGAEPVREMEAELEDVFRRAVRAMEEREHQSRIKAQIREEQKIAREIEREMKQIERERKAVEKALHEAEQVAKGQHSAEVEMLQNKIKELEERTQRTKSQAELTKAGHVYVISNVGSFGDHVFKIGMTRRLEPNDRVKELGDASVPFPFDVHMMISCEDAPSLENELHRKFDRLRVNKVNRRKEFFRVKLEDIVKATEELHGKVEYQVNTEALEYVQTLEMSDEDEAFIASVIGNPEDCDDE